MFSGLGGEPQLLAVLEAVTDGMRLQYEFRSDG